MNSHDIIRHPVLTEKSRYQQTDSNKFTMEVEKNANRIEIKRAVQDVFKEKVAAVNTMNVTGKRNRMRGIRGKKRDWKRAIITLSPGERIESFDGV